MRIVFLLALSLFTASAAVAQAIGQNAQPGDNPVLTLQVHTQLIIEAVTVRDKSGRFVPGLTAKDFIVTEDGVSQKIAVCEHETMPTASNPLPPLKEEDTNITVYRTLNRTQITPEQNSTLRYKNHRLLALYFDLSNMDRGDQFRALQAAGTFIRTQMTASDLVSILRFDQGSVDVLQDFTADRNRLLSILTTMIVGENQQFATQQSDASAGDDGAAFGQDNSEFNIFNTDRQLSALQTAANMLGHLNQKKALVYFSGGLQLNGLDNQAQLHATIDAAIRAGVSFWPVDARGLVAEPPMGDATQSSPGGSAMYAGTAQDAVQNDFALSQDTLYALGGDTGGKALLDTNDLTRGIRNAQDSISDYYMLGYYTTNTAQDGHFRRIKISVPHPLDAKLDFRQGYYAAKEFSKFTDADRERQLEDALMLEDPITDLTMEMELDYFQLNRAEYFVPLILKIPGRELALAKHGGAEHTLIDFIGEIKDVYGGTTVSNVRDHMNIKLADQTEAQLAHDPIEYDSGFTLLPGKYRIKLLARDDETGRIGTFETTFDIPNLTREQQRVPISSVVLSAQRIDLHDAVYNAMKSKDEAKEAAVNPLVVNGSKLIPSVTRVFSKSHSLYVYLQAYEEGGDAARPLLGYVSLYREGQQLFTSQPQAVTPDPAERLKTANLNFNVDLGTMKPGTYECQVSLLDPTTGKTSFWRAPIEVTP